MVSPDEIRDWNMTDVIRPGDVIIVKKTRFETTSKGEVVPVTKYNDNKTRSESATDRGLGSPRGADTRENVDRGASETAYDKSKEYVMPVYDRLVGAVNEKGKYIATGADPDEHSTRFYGYHKTLPIGSKVRLDIPDNAGFIEVKIIGRLKKNVDAMIGLSPACVDIIKDSEPSNGKIRIAYEPAQ